MKTENNMKTYLCGPINGCTDSECNDWRSECKKHFPLSIDPMRRDYRGIEMESVNEIVQLDKIDVEVCDVVIANCPKPSVGTSMEVFYAWTLNRPVVAIVPEGQIPSPWLKYHATTLVHSVRDAIEWVNKNLASG